MKILAILGIVAGLVALFYFLRHRYRMAGVKNGTLLELEANGRKYYVTLEGAQKELGIAAGETKVVYSSELLPEGQPGQMPLMVIRPHQKLIVKASGGKLSCPGSLGGGALLKGEADADGSQATFALSKMFGAKGHQGNGNCWIHLVDDAGKSTKLTFGYMITKG